MNTAFRSLLAGLALAAALTGCAASDVHTLKPEGIVVVEGETPTKMTAPDDGQITVYDVIDHRTIWTGAIQKGQLLVLDPPNKQLTLDGLACNMTDLEGGHTLRIWFDKTN